MKDIQVNNPQFDDAYLIRGNDQLAIPTILSMEVQQALLNLKEMSPSIDLNSKRLTIQVSGRLKTDLEYDLLIDSFLPLLSSVVQQG